MGMVFTVFVLVRYDNPLKQGLKRCGICDAHYEGESDMTIH